MGAGRLSRDSSKRSRMVFVVPLVVVSAGSRAGRCGMNGIKAAGGRSSIQVGRALFGRILGNGARIFIVTESCVDEKRVIGI